MTFVVRHCIKESLQQGLVHGSLHNFLSQLPNLFQPELEESKCATAEWHHMTLPYQDLTVTLLNSQAVCVTTLRI